MVYGYKEIDVAELRFYKRQNIWKFNVWRRQYQFSGGKYGLFDKHIWVLFQGETKLKTQFTSYAKYISDVLRKSSFRSKPWRLRVKAKDWKDFLNKNRSEYTI